MEAGEKAADPGQPDLAFVADRQVLLEGRGVGFGQPVHVVAFQGLVVDVSLLPDATDVPTVQLGFP